MTRRTLLAAGAAVTLPAPGATAPLGALLPGARLVPDAEHRVAVPGGTVYVRVNGDLAGNRPPILLIHGGPGSSHWYFLNATAMADTRAVILYDQLDSGRSDRPGDPANWRLPRFLDEIEAIRSALGITRWHVLGASWGGTLALEYAARRPAALAGLILQSALIDTATWIRDAGKLKDAMPPAIARLLTLCDTPGAAPAADCQAATDAFYRRHIHLYDPPRAIAAYRDALPLSFNNDIYTHMWGRAEFTASGTLKSYDGRPLLDRLDGPNTLFATGEHDEARPATVAGHAAHVPGAGFATIPDAAHSIFNDNPAAFIAVLEPWLAARDGIGLPPPAVPPG